MKAVWYEESGDANVLQVGEMPDPDLGPGEVRVRVVVSGINPSDWKMRVRAMRFPMIVPNTPCRSRKTRRSPMAHALAFPR
jgi:NADPH2:quinone reductase